MAEASVSKGLQRILDRIVGDAYIEAATIREDAKKRAGAIVEERKELAKRDSKGDVERILREAEEAAGRVRKQIVSGARVESARLISVEKNRLIEEVLKATTSALGEFKASEERYLSVLAQMIRRAAKALGGGELEVLLCSGDQGLASKLDLKGIATSLGIGGETRLRIAKESVNASGGVVVRRMDGRALADYTFESLIDLHERALRLKVARALFKP